MSATQTKIAVVTGANKGIGYEIAKNIATTADFKCILAARSAEKGEAAAKELRDLGADVEFRQLDLADEDSINAFVHELREDYGRVDVLVNNAGMAFKQSDPTPFKEQTAPTIETNFWGTVHLTHALLPLMRGLSDGARIVFVASGAGHLDILKDESKRQFISKPELTRDELFNFVNEYCDDVEEGHHEQKGWPSSNYGIR